MMHRGPAADLTTMAASQPQGRSSEDGRDIAVRNLAIER